MVLKENADFLQRVYKAMWMACGASEKNAKVMAHCISMGNRNGKMGQGLAIFEIPFFMWQHQMLDISAKPSVVQKGKNYVVVDGNRGDGQNTAWYAMKKAIKKAKKNTFGIAFMRNFNDIGFQAAYIREALKHDMIEIGMVNTVPLTAPYGGREAKVSAAPFTIACHAGKERPIIFDSAVSEAYDYDMVMRAIDNKKMDAKLLIDPETGELTDDPKPYVEQPYNRISAVLAPTIFSNPKLYGFNIFTEIMTGLLTPGGLHVNQIPYPASEYESGDARTSVGGGFFMAINIKDLMPIEVFKAKTDHFIQSVKATKPAKGFTEVFLPGERGQMKEEQFQKDGVPFRKSVWEKLLENAEKVGVDVEALR
jgi:LDH2 family malate/lactate/ureidoglycolate dehydrogenase